MGLGFAKASGGQTQERFRLDKCIGQGGMGSVYKAYDQVLERTVAVKILHPTMAGDERAVELFKREVQLASGISHPNVLRIFDFGELRGAKIISMAYVDSPNLGEAIRRAGRLSWVRSLQYAVQICAGLEAAHAAGVIHRDLKPQNILVDRTGHAYIADFGLAKARDEELSCATRIEQPPGAPQYMSPEQCLGLPVDQRTDIFSFGAILHAMLTGEPPLSGGVANGISGQEMSLANEKLAGSGAPDKLIEVVRRCLLYAPEDRYPEVTDILVELRPLLERSHGNSDIAVPDKGAHRRRWSCIWPTIGPRVRITLLTLLTVLLLSAGFVGGQHGVRIPPGLAKPEAPPRTASLDSRVAALQVYEQGKDLLAAWKSDSDLRAAVDLFEEAVKQDPSFSAAHAGLVTASLALYRQTKERQWLEGASRAAETALAIDADAVHTRIAVAEVDLAKRQFPEAIALLEKIIGEQGAPDHAFRLLASAYLRTNAPLHAIQCGERAVELNPSSWQNHSALGATYYATRRFEEAESEFRRGLELNPESGADLNNLGAICLQSGRFEEALRFFERALRLMPAPEAYSNVGTLYFLTERYQLAVMAFEKAVSLRPKSEVLTGNLAWAYQLAGMREHATRTLVKAIDLAQLELELAPMDTATMRRLALYQAKSDHPAEAERILAKLREQAPEDSDFLYTQAAVKMFGGNAETAIEDLELALQAGYPATFAFADPAWRELRENRRFRELRERFGPPAGRDLPQGEASF